MPVPVSGVLRFDGFQIDRAQWQLRYGDDVLPLNRKTFDLLLYLAEHADRVVTKDELMQVLWPEQFIEESNLTQQVFLLRRALGRGASGNKFIETVPGRGYRFAVPVRFEPRRETPVELQEHVADPATHRSHESTQPQGADPGAHLADPSHGTGQSATASGALPRNEQPLRYEPGLFQTKFLVWSLALVLAGLSLAYVLTRPNQSAPLSISAYTQITHDGHAKSMGGTDGSRIYFTRLEKSAIAQVSVSGKGEALLPVALQDPWSGAVSPDGSTLLIVSQGTGQGPAASLWAYQLVSGTLRRLGNAISSAWSPDGEQIVYASATGELCIMRSDGTDPHRIASVGGNVSSLAWSPDGGTIRFSRDGLLWGIAPDGSHLAQLLPGWGNGPTQWSGEWSPTGQYFFVADGQLWILGDRKALLPKMTPAPVQLTYGPTVWDRPIPSRDGKALFASGRTRRGELVRFDPASAQPSPFLAGISAEFVTVSRAANALAYVSFPDGILWRANVDGSNPAQLTKPPVYPKSVCWSPDGRQLAFVDRAGDNASAIFVIAANGAGGAHRLVEGDTNAETDPSWSPDGRRMVFATAPNVGASGRSDLRIFDLATGKSDVLPGSDGLLAPRWSPDGHAISAMTLDAKGLKVLDLPTGHWSSLDTGAVAFPEWSHDSQWIYYVRWTIHPALLRMRVGDGKREVLANLTGAQYTGAYTLWMGLDPDDRPMMLRDAGTDDIYALTLRKD